MLEILKGRRNKLFKSIKEVNVGSLKSFIGKVNRFFKHIKIGELMEGNYIIKAVTYLYSAFDCMLLLCHVLLSE